MENQNLTFFHSQKVMYVQKFHVLNLYLALDGKESLSAKFMDQESSSSLVVGWVISLLICDS